MTSPNPADAPKDRPGATLLLWAALIVVLNAWPWASGQRPGAIAQAIEQGAARIETQTRGEIGDDTIRKAIRTQRETYPFWRGLALIGDFGLEPIAPAIRAIAFTTLLAALAALVGRPIGFHPALTENAWLQGWWVAGLAVAIALPAVLGNPNTETTAALLLPAGRYPAITWLTLRQVDPFILVGWILMVRAAQSRKQANLLTATTAALLIATTETAIRVSLALVIGAGIHRTILPD